MRKILYSMSAIVALAAVILVSYALLFSPRIIISAPVGTSVAVYTTPGNIQAKNLVATNTSTLLRLKAGTYKISLQLGAAKEYYYASVVAFHKATYVFEPTKPLTAGLATRQVAYNALPDGNGGITYLNTTTRLLENISNTGAISTIGSSQANGTEPTFISGDVLSAPHIISGNRAIVVINSRLYLLDQNRLTLINMTNLPSDFTSLTIGTNPLQESFVIAVNNALYEYSSPTTTPQEIISLNNSADILALGGNEVIAYSTRMPNASAVKSAYAGFAIDPIVINLSNKTQHVLAQGPVTSVSVSPDGRYATVKPLSASLMMLYDLRSGKTLFDPDASDIIVPLWVDNGHYLYAQGAEIWREDVTNRTATLITNISNETELTSLTFSSANNEYFVTTYQSEDNASIYRIQVSRGNQ